MNCKNAWVLASANQGETVYNLTNLSNLRECYRNFVIAKKGESVEDNNGIQTIRNEHVVEAERRGVLKLVSEPLQAAGHITYILDEFGRVTSASCFSESNCARRASVSVVTDQGVIIDIQGDPIGDGRHGKAPPDYMRTYLTFMGFRQGSRRDRLTDNARHVFAQSYFTDQRKYTVDWDPINFHVQGCHFQLGTNSELKRSYLSIYQFIVPIYI